MTPVLNMQFHQQSPEAGFKGRRKHPHGNMQKLNHKNIIFTALCRKKQLVNLVSVAVRGSSFVTSFILILVGVKSKDVANLIYMHSGTFS